MNESRPVVRVKANLKPRNTADAIVCSITAVLLIGLLTAVPGFLVWAFTSSIPLGVVAGIAFYVFFLRHVVTELEVSDSGIRFVRRLGTPRELAWAELDSVEEVAPLEVMLWGWFLPPFPAREMSPSFSMYGHVAFRWKGRTVYFPPRGPGSFRGSREGAASARHQWTSGR